MSKANIIVMNDKGGVGKSLVTAGICVAAAMQDLDLLGVEAEAEPRLALRYPGMFDHIHITDVASVMARDANASLAQFDPLFDHLEKGGRIIDLGANVAERMFTVFEGSDADTFVGDGSTCAIVVVTTSDTNSVKSAVKNATTAKRVMPAAKGFVVLNEFEGKIPDTSLLAKEMRQNGFEVIRLPVCSVESWNIVKDLPLTELAAISAADLQKFGLSRGTANRDARDIKAFIADLARVAKPVVDWAKGVQA